MLRFVVVGAKTERVCSDLKCRPADIQASNDTGVNGYAPI
jgi:hypothetical protein